MNGDQRLIKDEKKLKMCIYALLCIEFALKFKITAVSGWLFTGFIVSSHKHINRKKCLKGIIVNDWNETKCQFFLFPIFIIQLEKEKRQK